MPMPKAVPHFQERNMSYLPLPAIAWSGKAVEAASPRSYYYLSRTVEPDEHRQRPSPKNRPFGSATANPFGGLGSLMKGRSGPSLPTDGFFCVCHRGGILL